MPSPLAGNATGFYILLIRVAMAVESCFCLVSFAWTDKRRRVKWWLPPSSDLARAKEICNRGGCCWPHRPLRTLAGFNVCTRTPLGHQVICWVSAIICPVKQTSQLVHVHLWTTLAYGETYLKPLRDVNNFLYYLWPSQQCSGWRAVILNFQVKKLKLRLSSIVKVAWLVNGDTDI